MTLDVGQIALDIIGIFDQSGLADGSNALISLARGNYLDSLLWAISIVPIVGDVAKLGKLGRWAQTVEAVVSEASKVGNVAFASKVRPILEAIHGLIPASGHAVFARFSADLDTVLQRVRTKIDAFLTLGYRGDFDEHVVKVTPNPDTGGYVIKDGSISGGHNAREFQKALDNPHGDGVQANVLSRTPLFDDSGRMIGETIEYRVPKINGKGDYPNQSMIVDGQVVYKPDQEKTVYFDDKISGSEMIVRLRAAGKRGYNREVDAFSASSETSTHFQVNDNGLIYEVYLKKGSDGSVIVDNVHLIDPE